MTDLAKMAINAEKNGMDISTFGARGIDRGLALMQLEKVANNAGSWNLSRRGALRNEDVVLSKEAQKAIDANAEKRASIDAKWVFLRSIAVQSFLVMKMHLPSSLLRCVLCRWLVTVQRHS
jgi:hypothetical protein